MGLIFTAIIIYLIGKILYIVLDELFFPKYVWYETYKEFPNEIILYIRKLSFFKSMNTEDKYKLEKNNVHFFVNQYCLKKPRHSIMIRIDGGFSI